MLCSFVGPVNAINIERENAINTASRRLQIFPEYAALSYLEEQ